ncbi:MAG: transcriptional regulator [Flavobacteriales bacterium]|nr:transcriptional regulator [Flavobacteriales bacterium]
MKKIPMVDLYGQYFKIKEEIDSAVLDCMSSTNYINGPQVEKFSIEFKNYLNAKYVIPCANGTDALQIALMSLDLKPGDEIICPAFTYVATAEVIALLGLTPVMCDVDSQTFNVTKENIEPLITKKTKVIVPVHLFGQSCQMKEIVELAKSYNLYIIEDNAQSVGADCFLNDSKIKTGTIGDIGTVSFFPSKNLGCFGDGGAIITNNEILAKKIKMIANHGQLKKYYHQVVGCNSRLDSIQASILSVKLKYLDDYILSRNKMAKIYDNELCDINEIKLPYRSKFSSHVFHQYTIQVNSRRDELQSFLLSNNIPAMIYYPVPLYRQKAYTQYVKSDFCIKNVDDLCNKVLSLPIHTEIENSHQDYIIDKIKYFFN